ncbi:hypothetical protein PORY_000331 [Pneumocystis oryctolagi]|uniref:Uncharacterized protein n=1 Tax=Pneumocystis oryctolagi TaxID=42067 RepID=A0ACB7CFF5_9ASCO|nr:hypothetical protein PORY_000331 [Pneumocystis oryctolagi]
MDENVYSSPQLSSRLSLSLSYQQILIHEIYNENGLVVLAKGLGLLNIVANLLHLCNLPGCLTLVIGASGKQEELLKEMIDELAALDNEIPREEFKIINNASGTSHKRTSESIYNSGGVFSVTSRILVVDLLTGVIDPAKISGIVALNAEKVNETSLEAFILRIFRNKNKIGYIKAFSDSPEAFNVGLSPLSNIMKIFFLRKCFLWPRFHVLVAESLESKKVDVIELDVAMTESMKDIQHAIIECMEICISGLKSANSGKVDVDDWNLDNALHKSFDIMIRRQLDLHWHLVSQKTKQLISDLATLRRILYCLLSYDCVSFYKVLETILIGEFSASEINKREKPPWLLLDSANTIFKLAKERVYKKIASNNISTQKLSNSILPVLENQPKLVVLRQIMQEIEAEIRSNSELNKNDCVILIMCKNEYTCCQIQEYLNEFSSNDKFLDNTDHDSSKSECSFLKMRFKEYLIWKQSFSNIKFDSINDNTESTFSSSSTSNNKINVAHSRQFVNKRRRVRGDSYAASNTSVSSAHVSLKDSLDYNEIINTLSVSRNEIINCNNDSLSCNDSSFETLCLNDLIIISPYSDDIDDITFKELKPKFIILYEPDHVVIRRIEVYHSVHKNSFLRVYFMYYGNSIEEQKYLATVRKEKDSFTRLIQEKGNMAVLLTHNERNDEYFDSALFKNENTRIAGGSDYINSEKMPRIIVDIREFRNPLPFLLYSNHITVIPCQLTVGDYILSPSLCVERKSIRDLICSLNNGRLYNQCEMMQQYYSTPILLIEFDQNKTFNLDSFIEVTGNININTLQSKLVLLTIAFPKLKIIWSSSPYATCEIFASLKKNQNEPDPAKAVSLGLRDDEDSTTIVNQGPYDFLLSIPKVSLKNYKNIIYNVENICDLSNLEEKQISDLIGLEAGKAFRIFIYYDDLFYVDLMYNI